MVKKYYIIPPNMDIKTKCEIYFIHYLTHLNFPTHFIKRNTNKKFEVVMTNTPLIDGTFGSTTDYDRMILIEQNENFIDWNDGLNHL